MKDKLKRIDFLGTIIFIGSSTSFLLGLTAGGILYEWDSANVIAPIVIGILGMITFWFVEEYVAKEPLMPIRSKNIPLLQGSSEYGHLGSFSGALFTTCSFGYYPDFIR